MIPIFISKLLTLYQKIMNWELKYAKIWLGANKLASNIEKTNFLLFHSAVKKITEPKVQMLKNLQS